jgi:hypothetical protein
VDPAAAPAEEQVEGPQEGWAAVDLEAPVWGLVVQVRAWEAGMLVEEVQEWEAEPTHPEWAAADQVIPVQESEAEVLVDPGQEWAARELRVPERDRGRQDRSRVARRELAADGRPVSPCRVTSRVCLCHRVFGFLGQPIEFRLEHQAVSFEGEIVAFPRHEHRLSIEKQTP